jgi:steroid delta-isomerase-like uncharacterized protein
MANAATKLVSDLLQAWNSHDLDRAVTFYSPGYQGVDVSQALPQVGREGIRQTIASYLEAFPDLCVKAEEIISQGDRVVIVWNGQGTHHGKLMNIPPTGRTLTTRGVTVLTIEDNQVTHALYFWDVAGLLREIGLLPEL